MTVVADLWRPRSTCGPHCLPRPAQAPAAPLPTRSRRLLALIGTLVLGAVLLPVLPLLTVRGRYLVGRA